MNSTVSCPSRRDSITPKRGKRVRREGKGRNKITTARPAHKENIEATSIPFFTPSTNEREKKIKTAEWYNKKETS